MDEFETVADPTGFSWKRKLVPSDADGLTRKRINGYNRLAKKRARDRHAQPAQQQQSVDIKGIRSKRTRESIVVVWDFLADIVLRAEDMFSTQE